MSPESVAVEAGVKTVTFSGTIENAYGKTLPTPINYEASYEEILSYDAIPPKELPDKDDVLSMVNNARKANARQKAMQSALDAAGIVKPTLESDVDLQVKTIAKALVASGKYTQETAEAAARATLGL